MIDFNTGDHKTDRVDACRWAHGLIENDHWVILDTETSGLGFAEVLQIGLLAPDGTTLMDTLVKPDWTGFVMRRIQAEATAIHGITDGMLEAAPALTDLLPEMTRLIGDRLVVVYNADFDFNILRGCLDRRGLIPSRRHDVNNTPFPWMAYAQWSCAMIPYSAYVGNWNDYHANYRWQRLPGGDHSAIGDCKATLAVIKEMAGGDDWADDERPVITEQGLDALRVQAENNDDAEGGDATGTDQD